MESLTNGTLQDVILKGGGTGPAGPVLAGPLFHRASKTFEQTKKTNAWQANINISYMNVNNIN